MVHLLFLKAPSILGARSKNPFRELNVLVNLKPVVVHFAQLMGVVHLARLEDHRDAVFSSFDLFLYEETDVDGSRCLDLQVVCDRDLFLLVGIRRS